MDPIILVLSIIILISVSIYVSNREKDFIYNLRYISSTVNAKRHVNADVKDKYIKKLETKIDVLEKRNSIIYAESGNTTHIYNSRIIPTVLINLDGIIIEISESFVKEFELYRLNSLIGTSFNNIAVIFKPNDEILREGLLYVKETNQPLTLELIDKNTSLTPILYKTYISKVPNKDLITLEFVDFILTTLEIPRVTDPSQLLNSNIPTMIIDTDLNIIDRNSSIIDFFNNLKIEHVGKKLYQIFPSIESSLVLEYLSKLDQVSLKIIGKAIPYDINVNKILINEKEFYLYAINSIVED